MKISIYFVFLAVLVGCGRKEDATNRSEIENARAFEKRAVDYLRPLVRLGDDVNELQRRFGAPIVSNGTVSNQVNMTFMFPNNDRAARLANVGGFDVTVESNKVIKVRPIYRL